MGRIACQIFIDANSFKIEWVDERFLFALPEWATFSNDMTGARVNTVLLFSTHCHFRIVNLKKGHMNNSNRLMYSGEGDFPDKLLTRVHSNTPIKNRHGINDITQLKDTGHCL